MDVGSTLNLGYIIYLGCGLLNPHRALSLRQLSLSFLFLEIHMSSSVKLFNIALSPFTRGIFFISEYTETVWRPGSALSRTYSWLQGMSPGKEKGGRERKEGREWGAPQFLIWGWQAAPLVLAAKQLLEFYVALSANRLHAMLIRPCDVFLLFCLV